MVMLTYSIQKRRWCGYNASSLHISTLNMFIMV